MCCVANTHLRRQGHQCTAIVVCAGSAQLSRSQVKEIAAIELVTFCRIERDNDLISPLAVQIILIEKSLDSRSTLLNADDLETFFAQPDKIGALAAKGNKHAVGALCLQEREKLLKKMVRISHVKTDLILLPTPVPEILVHKI
jgi:hypothetical protein